jgi:hypothetical protein
MCKSLKLVISRPFIIKLSVRPYLIWWEDFYMGTTLITTESRQLIELNTVPKVNLLYERLIST